MGVDVSRRGFLRRVARPRLPTRRRPPGALRDEHEFLARCTACGDCVVACPKNAVHTLAAHVRPGAGTPVMVPDARACHMCEGFPCAGACTTGALHVPEAPTWKLGTVAIDPTRCLPYLGPECGACAGLCPPGAEDALTLVARTRPKIDPARCVGCGLCIEACPTRPAALTLAPVGPG